MKRRNLYLILAVLVLLIGAGLVTSLYIQAGRHVTSFEDARPLPGAVLYDQEGEVIKRLGTGAVYQPLDQTPQELQNAVKSTEKSSTINNRLARQILEPQGFWARLQLAILPSVLERRYSERERLEIYLNNAYFGEGAYGAEAASQTYFAKPVKDIDLAQSTLLAALAQEPENASPFSNPGRAQERRNAILVQMEQDGHISPTQQKEAEAAAIDPRRREPGYAHHFSDYLGSLLVAELGEDRVFQGGLRVTTTLDRELQRLAETMFQEAEINGALVALNPDDGAILAMVGGLDYMEDSTNLATVKHQEVGSSLRPLIYATALQEDWAMNHLVEDVQRTFGDFEVDNTSNRYWGTVTMKHALVMDLNNAAVWTLNELGLERFNEFAQSVGLNIEQVDQDLRLATGEVREGLSLLDLTSAYLPGVGEGHYIPPSGFERVTDTNNQEVIANQQGTPQRVLSAEQAYLLTDMLMPATTYGSIRQLDIPFPAALHGSTSQDGSSNWAIGYTPSLLLGVHVRTPEETEPQLLAGDLWIQFMTNVAQLTEEQEEGGEAVGTDEPEEENQVEFEIPDNVETDVLIDVFTGLLASERCPQVELDSFIEGTKP
ncbi:MAG: transglycosylase domain-containing protein, partial [Limnochordia bacterium]|nr:transglycosylase domain-containing protein [Limnochordia bacterium]